MFCLMCGDVWVGNDKIMLMQSCDPFYTDGDLFICPSCYKFFKLYDGEEQSKILHSHPKIENLEGKKVCRNCHYHDRFTWECELKSKITLIDESCEAFRGVSFNA